MAVVFDTSVVANGNGVTSVNHAGLTTAEPNELLICFAHLSDESKSITSIIGGNISFTQLVSLNMGVAQGKFDCWVAWANSPLSGLVFTETYSSGFPQVSSIIGAYKGARISTNGLTSVGATASLDTNGPATSVSNAMTTRIDGSLVVAGFGMTANNNMTAGANQTEDNETASVGGFSRTMLSRQDAATTLGGTSVTSSCSFSSSTNIGTIQVEILAAAAAHNFGFNINKIKPYMFSPGNAR